MQTESLSYSADRMLNWCRNFYSASIWFINKTNSQVFCICGNDSYLSLKYLVDDENLPETAMKEQILENNLNLCYDNMIKENN